MTDCWGRVSRQRLINTIVILWTLTEVPGAANVPRLNHVASEEKATRQLTFTRERGLVEIFAFLSSTTDDPTKVTAVCIEESSHGDSLTIRLATNSGDCSDVVSGMKRVAGILEQSSKRLQPKDVDNHRLLREIVHLDFWKILYRLRSKLARQSSKIRGKPALVTRLVTALDISSSGLYKTISAEKAGMLKEKIQNLQHSFEALEALPVVDTDNEVAQNLLTSILVAASQVAQDSNLPSVLKTAYPLDHDLRNHLFRGLGKLARYFSVSKDLVAAARTRKYTIFDSITVEPVRINQPPSPPFRGTRATLQTSIDELIKTQPNLKNHVHSFSIKQYLGKSYVSKSVEFQTRTHSAASLKIHAEIQLLFYYELYPAVLPPRVVCASKSPCYLCYLFFTIHGHFTVPETHGRIYPGWILPTWLNGLSDERKRCIGQNIDGLHAKLVQSIQYMITRRKMPFKYPNESVLWTAADWSASSLQSPVGKNTSEVSTASERASLGIEGYEEGSHPYEVSAKHEGSLSSSSLEEDLSNDPLAADEDLKQKSGSSVNKAISMIRSYCLTDALQISLAETENEVHIRTERFNLTVSRDLPCNHDVPEICLVKCRLIGKDELHRRVAGSHPVDVMNMALGSEMVLTAGSQFDNKELLLYTRDQILSLKYSCSKPP